MSEKMLKNIPFSEAIALASLTDYQEGQIVSRTLAQNKAVSVTLFAFDAGEEISTHESSGDALLYVLEGKALVHIDDVAHHPAAGEVIVMPAGIPHAVEATERFKMLLVVVFPAPKN